MTSAEQFLGEASYESHPGFKFATLKDFVSGTIVDTPRTVEVPSLKERGATEYKLVVNLTVTNVKGVVGVKDDDGNRLPDRPAQVGEVVSVWIGKGFQAQAVSDAAKAASGKPVLHAGGTFTIQWNDTKDTGQPQPAKLYKVAYEAPAKSTDVSGFAEDPF
jgi:hypothetical protein